MKAIVRARRPLSDVCRVLALLTVMIMISSRERILDEITDVRGLLTQKIQQPEGLEGKVRLRLGDGSQEVVSPFGSTLLNSDEWKPLLDGIDMSLLDYARFIHARLEEVIPLFKRLIDCLPTHSAPQVASCYETHLRDVIQDVVSKSASILSLIICIRFVPQQYSKTPPPGYGTLTGLVSRALSSITAGRCCLLSCYGAFGNRQPHNDINIEFDVVDISSGTKQRGQVTWRNALERIQYDNYNYYLDTPRYETFDKIVDALVAEKPENPD